MDICVVSFVRGQQSDGQCLESWKLTSVAKITNQLQLAYCIGKHGEKKWFVVEFISYIDI